MHVFDKISDIGVVPVVAIDDPAKAVDLGNALLDGDLPIAEITFRTDAAADAIAAMSTGCPDMLVGAGTVLTASQVITAKQTGSKFGLAPGFDPAVVKAAINADLPFAPGIMTPTDLQAALAINCKFMKFFPAGAAGGPEILRNIAAPFLHTGIGFNPTGGVKLTNMDQWLSLPFVKAVGGTWIATQKDIAEGNWSAISQNAREAVARAQDIRGA